MMSKLTKYQYDKYVEPYATPELKKFIDNLWFEFSSPMCAKHGALGLTDNKNVGFFNDEPTLHTFWHEIGHAFLKHQKSDNPIQEMRNEQDADLFADKILGVEWLW